MTIGRLIGKGRTAEVYEWEKNRVVKLYREEIDNNVIENEYRMSREIFKMNIPTPEVFNLIEHDNRLGIIYERVYGYTMTESLLKKPWTLAKGAKRLAEIHNSIFLLGKQCKIKPILSSSKIFSDHIINPLRNRTFTCDSKGLKS